MDSAKQSTDSNEVVLRCACCGLPIAKLAGNILTFQSVHNGEKHINRVMLQSIPMPLVLPVQYARVKPVKKL